jgi:hypothetical protein
MNNTGSTFEGLGWYSMTAIVGHLIQGLVLYPTLYGNYLLRQFFREMIRTTKITTSKTKKIIKKFANHHYIKNGFLVDHYYDITRASLHQKWLFS